MPPWEKYAQPAAAAPQGDPVIARDPFKISDEARKNRDQVIQEANNARAGQDQAAQSTKAGIENPQTLRKGFNGLAEVKAYTVATQQLSQALQTGEGAQAALALTYAFAKAMDPDSVVRESETASVGASQAWLD